MSESRICQFIVTFLDDDTTDVYTGWTGEAGDHISDDAMHRLVTEARVAAGLPPISIDETEIENRSALELEEDE